MPMSPHLSPPKTRPEDLGFYMPNSPFAKIAEESGLDFNTDKTFKKEEMSLQAKANDVFDEHHQGRRWAEKLALMTRRTGAYRELEGFATPYGGKDEDGVDPWVPVRVIEEAKETAKMKARVAARRLHGAALSAEKKKINHELWVTIGRPNLLRSRDKAAFGTVDKNNDGIPDADTPSPENVMEFLK